MEKAVLFTNYSDEDFSHTWDMVKYEFPAKQSTMLFGGLALHFAKHLAVRELNKRDKNTGGGALETEMRKAFSDAVLEAKDKTQLEQKVINANAKAEKEEVVAKVEAKGKDVDERKSAESIKKELDEFEGIKDK